MAVGPKFGSAGRSTRYSTTQTAEKLELKDGFETEQYYRKKSDTREETIEKLLSYGIANSADVGNPFGVPLTSVSLTETEETVMHESWTEKIANTDDELQDGALIAVDAMLYTRLEQRWTVSGIGALPEIEVGTPVAIGDYVDTPLVITAASTGPDADEVVEITIPAGAFLETVTVEGENTSWSTFTLTYSMFTAQSNVNPLTPLIIPSTPLNEDVQWADEVTPGYWTKSTRTTTLTSEGFATVTTSTELHEKHADSVTGVVVP